MKASPHQIEQTQNIHEQGCSDSYLGHDWLRVRHSASLERMIIDEIVNRTGPGSLQHDLERITPCEQALANELPVRENIKLRPPRS